MGGSIAGRNDRRCGLGAGDPAGRRSRTGSGPGCERLEARDLLAAALSGGFLSPASAVVDRAQAVISGGAAAELSRFQADLQRAEQSSRVTPAAFASLKADGTSIAQTIETAPLTSQAVTQDLILYQDLLDQSFLDGSLKGSQWNQISQQLGEAFYGVTFTTNSPNQAFTDMQVVARQAHVTAAERQRLLADEKVIATKLGPAADTTMGGSVARDPVVVYYDGQVAQFVHKR